jgi:hypothetical protein
MLCPPPSLPPFMPPPPSPPQDVIPEDKQPELLDTISKGNVTMRVLRDIFESFLNMGPLSQVGVGTVCVERTRMCVCVGGGGCIETSRKVGCSMEVGVLRDIVESFLNMGPLSQVGGCVWGGGGRGG